MRILLAAVLIALLAGPAVAGPQLISGGAALSSDSTYVFTVTYKGNTTAGAVSVVVNNVSYPMGELDPLDTVTADGKVYYIEAELESGVNIYTFNCIDANGDGNTTAAKMLIVKDEPMFPLNHLDVMFSVLVFVPIAVYFIYIAGKMAKTLERIDRREEEKNNKEKPS
jgi:hypothetical protein